MNKNKFIGLIALILLTSCNTNINDSIKSQTEASSDSLTLDQSNSIKPAFEEPRSILDDFSVKDLFKNQNSDVVNVIALEDFELALKKIKYYWLNDQAGMTETQKANLRYMHIYVLAGLVSQKKKSRSELDQIIDTYKGEFIITQYLEITQGNGFPFNQVQVEQEDQDTLTIACANNDEFTIHCFVNVGLLEKFDLTKHIGKHAYLGGKLMDYQLSDKDVFSWISSLELSQGFVKILEDEMEKE